MYIQDIIDVCVPSDSDGFFMISLIMPILFSAIMISPESSLSTPKISSQSSSYFLNERVKPSESRVEKMQKMGILTAFKKQPGKRQPAVEPTQAPAIKYAIVQAASVSIMPTAVPTVPNTNYPQDLNYEEIYKNAGEKYGIPWQILFGLHKTETGCRNGPIFNSIGSGAQGPMQFMPGTWRAYGVDGDGDGVADINNAIDAIHGAANYLTKHGSLENGLRAYGGNYSGTLAYASEKGFNL